MLLLYNKHMELPITDKTGTRLTAGETAKKIINRIRSVFLEFEIYFLHLIGCVPIHRVRRFFYRWAGMKIGRGSAIHMGSKFYDPKHIIIGEDTIIGEDAILDGRDKLYIGNHVDIATGVSVYNSEHNINDEFFLATSSPVIIEDYVFIGPRVIIQPGVKIGRGAIVAAGAVVVKDVPPYAIVGGVPSKIIGERKNKNLHYKLGRARWFR